MASVTASLNGCRSIFREKSAFPDSEWVRAAIPSARARWEPLSVANYSSLDLDWASDSCDLSMSKTREKVLQAGQITVIYDERLLFTIFVKFPTVLIANVSDVLSTAYYRLSPLSL